MSFKHPIFTIALSIFFLMDSIGNVPIFISLLKRFPPRRQLTIIIRELLIALAVIFLFYFIGNFFLDALSISTQTLRIAGGLILFLISIKMIFPSSKPEPASSSLSSEPFIVPLAIPLVAGPAILAAVMIYSGQELPTLYTVSAIFIAWICTTLILIAAPFLQKILGERGIIALERLMGLILILIAIQMFLDGVSEFVVCHKAHT